MALIASKRQYIRVGMVDVECGVELFGVMTCAAIRGGYQVCGYRRRLAGRHNAVGIVMAGFAGQYRGIDQAVIEYPIETKGIYAMAITTIDGCQIDRCHNRMAGRWVTWLII